MRPVLLLSTLTALALTGCASSTTAAAPTETVTVTVTPSASPSPTSASQDELDAWAQQIEATIEEHLGTWEEQCQEADFPIDSCFITGLGAAEEDMLTVTMDLTPDKVPGLETPFERYREVQAEEAFLTISHAFRQIDELPARPEQIRVYDAQTEEMIGFADSDNGGLYEWYSFSD